MKKVLRFGGWVLWTLVLVIVAFPALSRAEGGGVFLVIYLILSGFYFLVHFSMRHHRAQKKVVKAEKAEKVAAGLIPAHTHTARHEAGLPVPNGSPCEVRVFTQRLEFLAGAQLFQIPMERVMDAQEYSDTEMRAYVKSSLFQTILGGTAFGEVGAVIGAMPETKYKREVSKYNLAVNFVTETGEISAVVLSADQSLLVLSLAIKKYCRGSTPEGVTTL